MQNRKKIIRLPLFWKFAIISIFVIFIFGSINIYLLWSSVYTSFEKEIDKRCKVLAKLVSDKALTPLVYDNFVDLFSILDEIKQSDPSISYIFILDKSNHLIAQTYDIKLPAGLLRANSLNNDDYNIKVIRTSNFKYPVIRDIAYPILNGEVGTVRLGIVEEHIQQEIMEATKNLVIMISAFLIFGLAGAMFFSYIITSPIKKISQKAQIIDLNYIDTVDFDFDLHKMVLPFNIQIYDELDVLMEKFSEMLGRLKNSYLELKETQGALTQTERLAALGTLSSGVAHEINNPISGIKNCLNRIIKNPENIEQNVKYIMLIKEATERIENVVQHLLKFSRKQDILLVKTDLNLTIESAISLTDHKLQSNHVDVITDYDETYFVNGSAGHLEQVFVNLLLNGYDAIIERKEQEPSHQGKIVITINQDSNKIYIHFKDDGNGIPDEISKKIFDPFFTSKMVGKGTGLGLSVSFNLIKRHGGKINFTSTKGSGTEFVIELPMYQV